MLFEALFLFKGNTCGCCFTVSFICRISVWNNLKLHPKINLVWTRFICTYYPHFWHLSPNCGIVPYFMNPSLACATPFLSWWRKVLIDFKIFPCIKKSCNQFGLSRKQASTSLLAFHHKVGKYGHIQFILSKLSKTIAGTKTTTGYGHTVHRISELKHTKRQ